MTRRAATIKAAQLTRVLDAEGADADLGGLRGPGPDIAAIDLGRAARTLLVMSQERSPDYRRIAARWLNRYVAETQDLTPAMLADAAEALVDLEHGDLDAAERLRSAVRRAGR